MHRLHRYQALSEAGRERTLPSGERRRALLEVVRTERERAREDGRRRRAGLLLTGAVAALCHGALILPLISAWLGDVDPAPPTEVKMVSLRGMGGAKAPKRAQEAERRPPPPRDEERRRRPEAEEVIPEGQVVTLPPPEREEVPEQADYLSEYNQRVERETRSRHQARRFKNATHAPQVGLDEVAKRPTTSESTKMLDRDALPGGPMGPGRALEGTTGLDPESGGGGAPQFAFEIPRQMLKTRLKLNLDVDGQVPVQDSQQELNSNGRQLRVAMGRERSSESEPREGTGTEGSGTGMGMVGGAGKNGLPSLAQLTPTLSELERVTGAPANDHLPDVETDAETRLNAWRWKHATFFNRVAAGIRRSWEGPELLARRDPAGKIYGTQSLTTVVRVTIDRNGNLVEVNVAEPSGAPFLDDEAVRTFRATAPFANPPIALFRGQENFTFSFGFNISYDTREIDLNWKPY